MATVQPILQPNDKHTIMISQWQKDWLSKPSMPRHGCFEKGSLPYSSTCQKGSYSENHSRGAALGRGCSKANSPTMATTSKGLGGGIHVPYAPNLGTYVPLNTKSMGSSVRDWLSYGVHALLQNPHGNWWPPKCGWEDTSRTPVMQGSSIGTKGCCSAVHAADSPGHPMAD